jgi:site-specific recombinase XerD
MAARRLEPGDLRQVEIERFVQERRATGRVQLASARTLVPLLAYLRGLGVVPPAGSREAPTLAGALLDRYAEYLRIRRGLAAETVRCYCNTARAFFADRDRIAGDLGLDALDVAAINAYLLRTSRRGSVSSAKAAVTGLRSLLRFLHLQGLIDRDLAVAVPSVANWRLASLVKALDADLNLGELGRAKAELASADAFLGWLADRGRQLEQCTQTDIDAWVSGPRKDRHIARQFARWAMAQKLMPPLEFPGGRRRGPAAPIVEQDPRELARRLLEDPEIPARERVAAILVAIYAQPIVRVARLTIDQIATTDTGTMTITLAQTPVTLPVPVSAAVRAWLDQRQANMLPLATPSPWLFPGNPPSRPMSEQQLSRRLKLFGIDCKHDRQAALLHLAGELPAAILADIVGVHVNTAGAWAEIAGRPWGDFPTLRGLH